MVDNISQFFLKGTPPGPDQAQGVNGVAAADGSLLAEHQERKGEGQQQRWRRHGMHEGSLKHLSLSLSKESESCMVYA